MPALPLRPANAAIAKRSWHESIDRLAARFRADSGVGTFWRDDPATGRSMLKLFRQGGALGILIDQDTRRAERVRPVLRPLAATPRAAADLALRFGAAVLVVTCARRGPRGGRRAPRSTSSRSRTTARPRTARPR